jgi:hypothetical protein
MLLEMNADLTYLTYTVSSVVAQVKQPQYIADKVMD